MNITDEQKERVKVLLDEVYAMMERTDNYIRMTIDSDGIAIYTMRGPFDVHKHYNLTALTDWGKLDDTWTLDTMRNLMRLEIGTAEQQDGEGN